MSENECKATLRGLVGSWAGETCGRPSLPGFSECWRHADVEKMAAKIVDLTGRVGALQREREDAMALVKSYQADLIATMQARDEARTLTERYRAERGKALDDLSDLQRSIASALFGAARDDDRIPPAKITGAMIDALGAHRACVVWPQEAEAFLGECASFLAEEDRRDK